MKISRRNLIGSLGVLFVAPAIVRAESLMPIKSALVPQPQIMPVSWKSCYFMVHGTDFLGRPVAELVTMGEPSRAIFSSITEIVTSRFTQEVDLRIGSSLKIVEPNKPLAIENEFRAPSGSAPSRIAITGCAVHHTAWTENK